MKATVQTLAGGSTVTLLIKGDFRFDIYEDFRAAYAGIEADKKLVLDLRQVGSMDSSAMGMLLNMKEHLGRGDGEIHIVNAPESVLKVLRIARFDKKFQIG